MCMCVCVGGGGVPREEGQRVATDKFNTELCVIPNELMISIR
jgi:hypothetical protein